MAGTNATLNLSAVNGERSEGGEPLLVHVGGAKDARLAELRYGLGSLIWRGPVGADAIGELEADPVTGRDALFDFATYERAHQERPDLLMGAPVVTARVAVAFTPGYFADPKSPHGLGHFLRERAPRVHGDLIAAGHRCQLVPVLALRDVWLTDPDLLEVAIAAIDGFHGPVGVVLASFANPLSAVTQIRGWVELLGRTGNVVALRTDEAAIGGLAHGAVAASVGTSSSARHLFVGRPSRERRPRRQGFDLLHGPTLSWLGTERLDGFAVSTDDLLCDCRICDGRSLRRLATADAKVEALAHSMAVLQGLAHTVVTADRPPERWADVCRAAVDTADRLNRVVEGYGLGRSVKAWASALQLTS
ncbi:MAG: hypothetical protein ABL966_01730 [Acidimicrobiales bacterium]